MERLIIVLLILGLISGIGVGAQRLLLERDFRTVELAVDLNDLLAGSKIERLPEVMETIEPWGVDSIVLTADPAQGWTPQELREVGRGPGKRAAGCSLRWGAVMNCTI